MVRIKRQPLEQEQQTDNPPEHGATTWQHGNLQARAAHDRWRAPPSSTPPIGELNASPLFYAPGCDRNTKTERRGRQKMGEYRG